ncbi:nuclear transport factor 2 family protein [Altererythrobacter aerius]|uniref:Nuclear transport factor 2 family protein n=1 Tax=Tsuneonella aeria TaxID=1837929 RepID=A0A6I4TAT1_9SPHN|nr:nuclear transport factor 2 family protein [Tsuneonella aeria]MXO74332.1 nuclear transport factor 2 family protein [Tsuneonella aeria]
MDAALSQLIDERAIEQIYVRYCELVDGKDFDRLDEVFTADTLGDYSRALGEGVVTRGLPALIAAMHHNLGAGSHCGATHHNVGNFRIMVEGGRARAQVHYIAAHAGEGSHAGKSYVMWGEYDDVLVRTPAGWRVAERTYTLAVSQGDPAMVSRG